MYSKLMSNTIVHTVLGGHHEQHHHKLSLTQWGIVGDSGWTESCVTINTCMQHKEVMDLFSK